MTKKPDDKRQEKITKLENKKKIAEALLELKDNLGMKLLLESCTMSVISADSLLREDGRWEQTPKGMGRVPLTERERAELVGKRDAFISLIESFPEAERTLKMVEDKLQRYES